jgi:hypothetical protein
VNFVLVGKINTFLHFLSILLFLGLTCSALKLIENGYFHPVKRTYEEGDVIQFFCHENYHLSGSDLIQCYNFGWYPESPVCEGKFLSFTLR